MNYFKHFAALGMLAIGVLGAKAADANLLVNPTTFDQWTVINGCNGSHVVEDGILKITHGTDWGDYLLYQNVTLEEGKTYTFFAQYRSTGNTGELPQFAGFWNKDGQWAGGNPYNDLAYAPDWTVTSNVYTPGDTQKSIVLAACRAIAQTVEYKNPVLLETPTLTVKENGEAVDASFLESGHTYTIECSSADFDIYYVIDEAAPVKYTEAIAMPADATSFSYYVSYEPYKMAEKSWKVYSLESIQALYQSELAKVKELYKDATAELLATLESSDISTIEAAQAAIAKLSDPEILRPIVESNALAEALGATVMTSSIINPNAADGINGWTQAQKDGGANIVSDNREGELPTLADGTKLATYFDGGNWGGSDWTSRFEQTITLPRGKYRISVLGRGSDALRWFRFVVGDGNANFQVVAENGAEATEATVGGWFKYVDMAHVGTPDDATFGKGWENYSIDFEVNPMDVTAEVLIGILGNSKSQYQWESFGYFRLVQLEADPTSNYEAAKSAAQAALENEEYAVVTGKERTDLAAAIPAEDPTGIDEMKEATNTILEATNAFTNAKAAYAAYNEAKETYGAYADDKSLATTEKLDALKALLGEANSAEEATSNAAALKDAAKAVVLSNSIAESVSGREDSTNMIVNPDATGTYDADTKTAEGWTTAQATNNAYIRVMDSEKPDYGMSYFDGETWGSNGWKTRFEQKVELPAGQYRLAVAARGSDNLEFLRLRVTSLRDDVLDTQEEFADAANIPGTYVDLGHFGNSGQLFGNGWNDYVLDFEANGEPVMISLNAGSATEHQWHSFTNFRLTKTGNAEDTYSQRGVNMTVVEDENAPIYDLQGRRVINPVKGIYIRNGKKFVVTK